MQSLVCSVRLLSTLPRQLSVFRSFSTSSSTSSSTPAEKPVDIYAGLRSTNKSLVFDPQIRVQALTNRIQRLTEPSLSSIILARLRQGPVTRIMLYEELYGKSKLKSMGHLHVLLDGLSRSGIVKAKPFNLIFNKMNEEERKVVKASIDTIKRKKAAVLLAESTVVSKKKSETDEEEALALVRDSWVYFSREWLDPQFAQAEAARLEKVKKLKARYIEGVRSKIKKIQELAGLATTNTNNNNNAA